MINSKYFLSLYYSHFKITVRSIAHIKTCANYPLILIKFNNFDKYFLLRVD